MDDELDRLQSILLERVDEDAVTHDMDEGVLNVSELDGLLTAVVSGPVTIVPSRWFLPCGVISSQRGTPPEATKLRDAIAPNARVLHAYWLARRAKGAQDIARQGRASLRVGRNEPCPCGSGKKHKRCCLQ